MQWVRRAESAEQGSCKGGNVVDAAFLKQAPALLEFLCVVSYEDGTPRVPGSATIFVEGGVLKLVLSDKDAGAVAFITAPTLAELLMRASKGLEKGDLDWRVSRPSPGTAGGGRTGARRP